MEQAGIPQFAENEGNGTGLHSQSAAPLPEPARTWARTHDVQFYEDERYLATAVAGFLAEGVRAGQPIVVIATPAHQDQFRARLQAMGVDAASLVAKNDVVWLDADDVLAAIMDGELPDAARFESVVGGLFRGVIGNRSYVVVRAFGEMVDILWKQGRLEGAILLEEYWNRLAEQHSFQLLCAYAMDNFFREAHGSGFRTICQHHAHVRPTETYLNASEAERLRQITLLQQRALALQSEVDRRKELEAQLRETLTERRRSEDEVRRRELELRDFLENGLEPMHWVNGNGIIVWANRAEMELLGYPRDEFVGRHVSEFYVDEAVSKDILQRLGRGEDLRNVEARLRCRDGSIRRVLINSNVYWQDGKFVHTRCFIRDITNWKPASLT